MAVWHGNKRQVLLRHRICSRQYLFSARKNNFRNNTHLRRKVSEPLLTHPCAAASVVDRGAVTEKGVRRGWGGGGVAIGGGGGGLPGALYDPVPSVHN